MVNSTLLIKSMATFGYNLSLSEAPAAAAEDMEGLCIDDLDDVVSLVEREMLDEHVSTILTAAAL